MTTSPKTPAILARHDAGEPVATISAALSVSPGYVYGILRRERPQRARKPRQRTSERRRMVLGLAADGHKVARIAFLCGVSNAYVYRILGELEQ